MQRLLLDTIAFDLLLRSPADIPVKSRLLIEDATDVFVSVVSLWEMANHVREGRIVLTTGFEKYVRQAIKTHHVLLMPLDMGAMDYMSTFEYQLISKPYTKTVGGKAVKGVKHEVHKDTFDRMIIAHALTQKLPVISPDEFFPSYEPLGLRVIWK